MTCHFIHEHLFSFQENRLSEEKKVLFTNHLNQCDACQQLVNEFNTFIEIIEHQKAVQPKSFHKTRALQYISSGMEKTSGFSNPWYRRILQPALMAVLLMISVSTGLGIGWHIHSKSTVSMGRQNEINTLKSSFSIHDFVDDDYFLFTQP
jgi:predicted anti-sigma-YlaC factor YlaD